MIRCFLLLIGFCVTANSFAITDDEIDTELNYIHKVSVEYADVSIANIERLSDAISLISEYLDTMNPSLKFKLILREYRLYGLETLNFIRFNNEISVYRDEVETILSDYRFLDSNTDISLHPGIEFRIGHVLLHLADDSRQAYLVWEKCANSAHAGCMSILASAHFSGREGVEQNIDKAIFWHRNVVRTGIDFNCSGVYSAIKLQNLAFSFPEKFDRNDWLIFNDKKIELDKMMKERRADNKSCYGNMTILSEYIQGKSLRAFSKEQLIVLLSSIESKPFDSIAKLFDKKFNEKDVVDVLSPFSNEAYCDASLIILEYLNKHNRNIFNKVNQDITDNYHISGCQFHQTLVQIKQTQGRW